MSTNNPDKDSRNWQEAHVAEVSEAHRQEAAQQAAHKAISALTEEARNQIEETLPPQAKDAPEERPSPDEAFLAAIVADPADDGPRLIYADWLDEHGSQGHAEFIRVQCELARLSEDDPRADELREREFVLFRDHRAEILAHLPPEFHVAVQPNRVRRGFVAEMAFGWRNEDLVPTLRSVPVDTLQLHNRAFTDFLAAREGALRPSTLMLRDIALGDTGHHLETLRTSPMMERVTTLDLSGVDVGRHAFSHHDAEMRRHLRRLIDRGEWHALLLSHCSGEGRLPLDAILQSPGLDGIRELDLSQNPLGLDDFLALARCPHLGHLRKLNIQHTFLNATLAQRANAIGRLLRSPHARNIVDLTFGGDPDGVGMPQGRDFNAVMDSPILSQLTALRYTGRIGNNNLDGLIGSPECPTNLKTLELIGGSITADGVSWLARCPALSSLTTLNLGQQNYGDEGAEAIAASPVFSRVQTLRLGESGITDEGLMALANSPHLTGVRRLHLPLSYITSTGIEAFVASPMFARLTHVHFQQNDRIDDRGAAAVANISGRSAMRSMDLRACNIGLSARRALADCPLAREGCEILC